MEDDRVIRAVLFDFDGTLTKGSALDFRAIREDIGCPQGVSLLEYIEDLEPEARHKAAEKLAGYEREGASRSEPNDGALELLVFLRVRKIPCGILTRNSRESILSSMQNFPGGTLESFRVVICRDDDFEVKPSAAGVYHAAEVLGVKPHELVVIGDYLYDVQAGNRAGAVTVFLDAGENSSIPRTSETYGQAVREADYTVTDLHQFKEYIDMDLPLLPGKIPNRLLGKILRELKVRDPSVIIPPQVGEDVAAVSLPVSGTADSQVVVLKNDPVTFVGENIGRYAVTVNANDLATSGAVPRWYLMDLLLPIGSTGSLARKIIRQVSETAQKMGITVCGGHSEVTDAVSRPVISGFLLGAAGDGELIRKENMREGDIVLMTKSAGCEGTGIIAQEFGTLLSDRGLTAGEIEEARGYGERIDILTEARAAAESGKVGAMHDVTEGGAVTAIWEFAEAGGHTLEIDLDKIPVSEITARVCEAAGLDPLGLIGSGSLLITCRPDGASYLETAIGERGVAVSRIGRVLGKGSGVRALRGGKPAVWPEFETDELTKLYGGEA